MMTGVQPYQTPGTNLYSIKHATVFEWTFDY